MRSMRDEKFVVRSERRSFRDTKSERERERKRKKRKRENGELPRV